MINNNFKRLKSLAKGVERSIILQFPLSKSDLLFVIKHVLLLYFVHPDSDLHFLFFYNSLKKLEYAVLGTG